jgi:hypothetical protein
VRARDDGSARRVRLFHLEKHASKRALVLTLGRALPRRRANAALGRVSPPPGAQPPHALL